MSPSYSQSEDAINKVLDGLRNTRAPEEMERRILQTLAESAALPEQKSAWWVMLFRSRTRWALASGVAAAAVLVAFLMPAILRKHAPPLAPVSVATLPPAAYTADTRSTELTQPQPVLRVQTTRSADVRKTILASVAAPSEESLSMERMLAPSLPAPPIPLTEQERALLHKVHNGAPVLLAAFAHSSQTQDDARQEAEFEDFFKSPYGPARTQDDISPDTDTDEPQKIKEPPKAETAKPAATTTA